MLVSLFRFSKEVPTRARLIRALNDEYAAVESGCELAGWIVDNGIHGFTWNSRVSESLIWTRACNLGSGKSFVENLERPDIANLRTPLEGVLVSVSFLVMVEAAFGTSLWHHFGGGIEVIQFVDGAFCFAPPTTYCAIFVRGDGHNAAS